MSTDPKYIGPGYWVSWHLKSYSADTKNKKIEVARNIALDISNFPCMECRNHAKRYVSKNPLTKAVDDKDPLSIFIWTYNFHNEVNARLNKKKFTLEEVKKMYSDKNVCVGDCSGGEEKKKEEEISSVEDEGEQELSEMLIRGF